jgi:pyrroline-5-carboxylate reductase
LYKVDRTKQETFSEGADSLFLAMSPREVQESNVELSTYDQNEVSMVSNWANEGTCIQAIINVYCYDQTMSV